MAAVQSMFSYKILLPLGIVLILLYSLQDSNNFIKVGGILKDYIGIFNGSKMQIAFFFGIPLLFATSFAQLRDFEQEVLDTLYVVVTILITMFFSILTVLAGYRSIGDEQWKKVLNETRCSILFELVLCVFITIYSFIFQMFMNSVSGITETIMSWILYYMIFVLILNMFVVIKRYKILSEFT